MQTIRLREADGRRRSAVLSDRELVALAQRAQGSAFEEIMRRNNRRLYRVAVSIVKDAGDAEEVVQEAYISAYKGLAGFKADAALATWLVKITVNQALGTLRRRRPETALETLSEASLGDAVEAAGTGTKASLQNPEAAARGEIRRLLEAAIDDLPEAFRAVFVLRALEEFSVRDTADCLGIPEATVKSRFHRAKRLLRRGLDQQVDSILKEAFPFAGARCDRIVAAVLGRLHLTKN